MKNLIKNLLKKNPRAFDVAKYVQMLLTKKRASWRFFDSFSKAHHKRVTFLYIGANDGMRSDPIRYFIVRDRWQGVLVEPLPDVFSMLKSNYGYLKNRNLVFSNTAISSEVGADLSFWTFNEDFLNSLSLEDRINYLRKSSFDKSHVLRWLRSEHVSEGALREIKVPSLSINELAKRHWRGDPINLIVIDAEGHEASIIPSIDFNVMDPDAIFFESHNLGAKQADVFSFLSRNGYEIIPMGGDSVAVKDRSRNPIKSEARVEALATS